MSNQTFGLNTENVCKGGGTVCWNGTPIGMLSEDSEVTLAVIADADVDIKALQTGGSLLGVRRGGREYRVSVVGIETTLGNISRMLDSGIVTGGTSASMDVGLPNALATEGQLTVYGKGPQNQTRRWTYHKCVLASPDQVRLAAKAQPNNVPMTFRVCQDLSKTDENCYFHVQDYTA